MRNSDCKLNRRRSYRYTRLNLQSIWGSQFYWCVFHAHRHRTLVYHVTASHGTWATYQLVSLNSTLVSTPISENLQLRQFTIKTKTKKPAAGDGLSVVSLGTSLVLLAGLVEGTQDISLQIWDLSYGVLLTAQSMPVPSAFHLPYLSLTIADEGQVLLTVSSSQLHEKRRRSSVHIVPVDARLKSSLAAALGKTALTAEWLIPRTLEDEGSTKIISDVQTSLQKNNAQKAEQAFLKWVDSHSVWTPSFHVILLLITRTVKRGGSRP